MEEAEKQRLALLKNQEMESSKAEAERQRILLEVEKQRAEVERKALEEQLKQKRAQQADEAKKTAENLKKTAFTNAEKYVKEYREKEQSLVRMRREASDNGDFFVEGEAQVAFVIRIRGINQVDPKSRKILQLLRLRQIFNGVFVRLNKASINMLRLVEPYIAYGYPNLKSIRELVYKRGYGVINNQRIPLTDNQLIADNLGKYGIVCVEDIIHEIYTVGPHFKEVNSFLWPFKLSSPLGGMKDKGTHFIEGGDYGNREDKINAFIRQMN